MLNIAQAALLVAAFGSGVTAQAALYGQCELSLSTEIPKPRMLTSKQAAVLDSVAQQAVSRDRHVLKSTITTPNVSQVAETA